MLVKFVSQTGMSYSGKTFRDKQQGSGYTVYCYVSTDTEVIQDQVTEGISSSTMDFSWTHTTMTTHYRYRLASGPDVYFVSGATVSELKRPTVYMVQPGAVIYDIIRDMTITYGVDGSTITYGYLPSYKRFTPYLSAKNALCITVNEPPMPDFRIYYGEGLYGSIRDRKIGWDPGALTASAMSNSQGLSINSLQYIREIPSIAQTFKDVAGGLLALRKGDIKGVASSFLAFKYGTSNTVRDTVEIAKYLNTGRSNSGTHFHASGGGSYAGYGYTLDYKDTFSAYAAPQSTNLSSQMRNRLRDADLLPSLENLWDAVPYSFVVDWVLPIGQLLSSVDASMDLQRFEFVQVYYSRLTNWSTWNPAWETTITRFQRWPHNSPVNPVGLSSYSKPTGNHFLEASALVVQRA